MTLNVKRLSDDSVLPTIRDNGSYNIYSAEDVSIPKHKSKVVKTDIELYYPEGMRGRISSPNNFCTDMIGNDIKIRNNNPNDFNIKKGDVIAHLFIEDIPVIQNYSFYEDNDEIYKNIEKISETCRDFTLINTLKQYQMSDHYIIRECENNGVVIYKIDEDLPSIYTLVASEFAINVKIEDIDKIDIIQGGMIIDTIYGEVMECLYDIYSIKKENENGWTIIPSYLSKTGIEKITYEDLSFKVELVTKEQEYSIQYKLNSSIFDKNLKCLQFYQVQKSNASVGRCLRFNYQVFLLIVKDSVKTLQLLIKDDDIILKRKKQYNALSDGISIEKRTPWSIFSFVNHLYDYNHSINFTTPSITVNNIEDIYAISLNGLNMLDGMSSLQFAQ